MALLPFVGLSGRANELLGLIHTNVCKPFSIIARGGYSYFIIFTNDFSRYGYVYLMKYKSKALEKFKELRQKWRTRLEIVLRHLNQIGVGNT